VGRIVHLAQWIPPRRPYEGGRRLLLRGGKAAVDGGVAGGGPESGGNGSPGAVDHPGPGVAHRPADHPAGGAQPVDTMQGLEAGADVVFMVGYHGSISGESSILSHTYNPSVVSHVTLNGVRVGESGINALVALACGVPIGLITGDRQTAAEADPFLADAERPGVQEALTSFGAAIQ